MAYGTAGRFQSGKTTMDLAAELGIRLTPCIKHAFNDGIEAGRGLWPQLEINEPDCPTFLKAAAGYGKKKNLTLCTDENTVYHNNPALTWHRHMMDAYRHLAMAYYYMTIGEDVLGQNETPYEEHAGERMEKSYEEYNWV
jgi:hypothetical protein